VVSPRQSAAPSVKITQLLRERGAMSQADIARGTGLGKSTVSRVIDELQRAGVVIDAGRSMRAAGGASGRPATALSLNPEIGTFAGVQLGPKFICAVLADASHAVLATRVTPLGWDFTPEQGSAAARKLIEEVLEAAQITPDRLIGVGIAMPGPVHPRTGRVIRSSMMESWSGIELARLFETSLGRPVVVDNDANCAAQAEFTWGVARGYSDVIYYKLDLGVGGAVIANGQLVRGVAGGAGEFGHMTYDPAGPLCRCGNRGCYELYISSQALLELLRPTYGADFTAARMIAAARAGDTGCRRLIADAAVIAGQGLATVCNAFNPELVVVAGEMTEAGDLLLNPLRESLSRHILIRLGGEPGPMTELTLGSLGQNASALGAMGLALRRIGGSESAGAYR
jgi:predicted NBD/HSP70 family sugar kinase